MNEKMAITRRSKCREGQKKLFMLLGIGSFGRTPEFLKNWTRIFEFIDEGFLELDVEGEVDVIEERLVVGGNEEGGLELVEG